MKLRLMGSFLAEFTIRAALIALITRAFVPVGWMPNPDGLTAGAPIILCTMQGAVPAVIGPDGKPKPMGGHSSSCVLGATAAHGAPVVPVALIHPSSEQIASIFRPLDEQTFFVSLHYRPQAARAPPVFG